MAILCITSQFNVVNVSKFTIDQTSQLKCCRIDKTSQFNVVNKGNLYLRLSLAVNVEIQMFQNW